MRFHPKVVEKLIQLNATYGGHADNSRLRPFIEGLRLSMYFRDRNNSTGDSVVLVESMEYLNELAVRGLPTNDVVAMVFHVTVVEKILNTYLNHAGYAHETRLRKALSELDLTPYKTRQDVHFLVLTEDYLKLIRGTPQQ